MTSLGIWGGSLSTIGANARAYEAWLGKPLDVIIGNAATSSDWTGTTSSFGSLVAAQKANAPRKFVLGLPGLPSGKFNRNGAQWTVTLGAQHWGDAPGWLYMLFGPVVTAIKMLPAGSTVDIRLMWEMNSSSQPWNAIGDPVSWKAYWRNIVTFLRGACPQQTLRFHFCYLLSMWTQVDLEAIYPGDDVVDVFGFDLYDQESPTLTPAQRWAKQRDAQFGLAWAADFAREHGKPLMIHECGAGALGDNPYFVEQIATYAKAANATLCWFEYGGSYPCELSTGKFPLMAAAFKEAFG